MGCLVSGEHPFMDAKKYRIEVEGDKKGGKAGFYVAYLDGHPYGYIKNNRTGIELKWKSKGYWLDPEQKAAMQAEATAKLAARAEQQQQEQEAVAQHVVKQMDDLVTVIEPTPYLKAKGITPQAGISLTVMARRPTFQLSIRMVSNGRCNTSKRTVQSDLQKGA